MKYIGYSRETGQEVFRSDSKRTLESAGLYPLKTTAVPKDPHYVVFTGEGEFSYFQTDHAQMLERLYWDLLYALEKEYHNELHSLDQRYSRGEREGWGFLSEAAKVYKETGRIRTVLREYAAGSQITVEKAASEISALNKEYERLYGRATGQLSRLRWELKQGYDAGESRQMQRVVWKPLQWEDQ